MLYKENWDKVKERLIALWEREIVDRCCISIVAPKDKNIDIDVFTACESDDPQKLKEFWENPVNILERNLKRMENTFFGGESLPQIFLNFGTGGHAIYFGADYRYTPESIWYFPVIKDWDSYQLIYNPYNNFLVKQFKIARFLSEEGKSRFFVSMPDNCGNLDALAHLRGTQNLLLDMVFNKERVKEATHILNDGWKKANEEFYQITRQCNEGGSTNGWMNTWAPGRQMQMQCDLSVMISPDLYKEFVIPELEEQMEWIEYPVYHLDGKDQIRHLDYLLSLDKLKIIQWTDVKGQEPPVKFFPALKRIQKAGKALIIFTPIEDIPELLAELSSRGLYLHTTADSEEEAREVIKYVTEHTAE